MASQAVNIAAVSVRKIFFHKEILDALYEENVLSSSGDRHHSGQTKKYFFHFSLCREIFFIFSHS